MMGFVTEKKPPSRKAMYGIVAFLALGALGMLTGATWTYLDEHSGTKATAHVTRCSNPGTGKYSVTFCTARWTVDGRTVTGDLSNGKMSYRGKDLSVRVHGNRATVPQVWVSIALAIFGVLIGGVAIWLFTLARRRLAQPT